MNNMSKVAELYGVEIGEKFRIELAYGVDDAVNPFPEAKYYFTESGLIRLVQTNVDYHVTTEHFDDYVLRELLAGDFEIVKIPWIPKLGEIIYRIMADGTIMASEWRGDMTDVTYYAFGNCFQTETKAEKEKDMILVKKKEVLKI